LIHPAVWPQQTWAEIGGCAPSAVELHGSTSNTMLHGPRPTIVPSGLLIHRAVWLQQWAENWGEGRSCPFWGGVAASHLAQCAWAEAYLHTKWHLDPCGRLATTDMGRKFGALPPFIGRGAGSPSNTMSLGLRPTFLPSGILIHGASWPQQMWTENWGWCDWCPFGGGRRGCLSNTMWPGPRPTCMPSLILIRPTV